MAAELKNDPFSAMAAGARDAFREVSVSASLVLAGAGLGTAASGADFGSYFLPAVLMLLYLVPWSALVALATLPGALSGLAVLATFVAHVACKRFRPEASAALVLAIMVHIWGSLAVAPLASRPLVGLGAGTLVVAGVYFAARRMRRRGGPAGAVPAERDATMT